MTKADKFLLAGLLCLSLVAAAALYGRFLFPGKAQPAQAVISVRGKVVRSFPLPVGAPSSFLVHGAVGGSTVELAGGRVRMLEAPCPGGVCVQQGWIERPGQSIVCVPGQILVRIEGAAPLDAVTR